MSEPILSINKLTKHYGRLNAVQELSLEVNKGEVYGILGPNGSGKTTTLGMILSVVNPTSGSYKWFGKSPTNDSRKRIGSILEQPIFYPYLTAEKNLQIIAQIKKIKNPDIDKYLKKVGLYERKHSKFSTYSYGMKQRLAIGAALLCEPDVLILDEPTNGLDPQGIADTRSLIIEVAKQGITIILASHLLDEVQKICSHVVVLEKGKKLFAGNVDEVLNESILVEIASNTMEELKIAIEHYDRLISFKQEGDLLVAKLKDDTGCADLNGYLFSKGITVNHLVQKKKTLEKYFLELIDKS